MSAGRFFKRTPIPIEDEAGWVPEGAGWVPEEAAWFQSQFGPFGEQKILLSLRDSNTGPSACMLVALRAKGGTHGNHQYLNVKIA